MVAVLSGMKTVSALAAVPAGFISDSKTKLNFRYRFERGIAKDANTPTLRSRLSFQSGAVNNFSVNAEVDNASAIGADDYCSEIMK